MNREGRNAEGYCRKCGNSLDISGTCYVCAVNDEDFKATFERVFTCPICGQRKTHYRLYGYRCSNPEHAQMEADQHLAEIKKKLGTRKR
jgi:hypothetical protein